MNNSQYDFSYFQTQTKKWKKEKINIEERNQVPDDYVWTFQICLNSNMMKHFCARKLSSIVNIL